jgi:hypothetical protein
MKGQGQSAKSEDAGAKNGRNRPAGEPEIVPVGAMGCVGQATTLGGVCRALICPWRGHGCQFGSGEAPKISLFARITHAQGFQNRDFRRRAGFARHL